VNRLLFEAIRAGAFVERHRANILEKLGMRDRVQLTHYAIRRGLIGYGPPSRAEPASSAVTVVQQSRHAREHGCGGR
jgi:hypothetical protein